MSGEYARRFIFVEIFQRFLRDHRFAQHIFKPHEVGVTKVPIANDECAVTIGNHDFSVLPEVPHSLFDKDVHGTVRVCVYIHSGGCQLISCSKGRKQNV